MKIHREVRFDEVVVAWLTAEVDSPGFSSGIYQQLAHHDTDEWLIKEADLGDASQNELRLHILETIRGGLLASLPDDVKWHEVTLDRADFASMRTMNEGNWLRLTEQTRRFEDAARRISGGKESDRRIEETADAARSGGYFPPVIVVALADGTGIAAIEGHARITAFHMVGIVKDGVEKLAFAGLSDRMPEWHWY